jgi:hypothetical protein
MFDNVRAEELKELLKDTRLVSAFNSQYVEQPKVINI